MARNDSKPLTAEQKKVCISKVVKQVCVFYDKQANQHRLEVELTTTASQTLRSLSGNVADLEGSLGIFAGALQPKGTVKELLKENPSVKKSGAAESFLLPNKTIPSRWSDLDSRLGDSLQTYSKSNIKVRLKITSS